MVEAQADRVKEETLRPDLSRGSQTSSKKQQHSITLPAVKHRRGLSTDAHGLAMSGSKNSATKTGLKNVSLAEDERQFTLAGKQRYLASLQNSGRMQRNMQHHQQTLSYTMPSNYELSALKYGFDPHHEATLKDFQAKNIGDLKSFKTQKIAHSKEQIELIHGQLRHEQGLGEELLNLHGLEQHLPTNMRVDFLNHPTHSPLLGYLSTLNACFVPVLDYLICFKSELGLALQRMIESYNMLLMAQFQGYFNSENLKTKEFTEKVQFVDIKIKQVTQQKAEQDYKQKLINTLIQSKDTIIDELNGRIEALEAKDAELHEYIKSTKMNLDEPAERIKAERAKIMEQIANADVESEELSSDSDMQLEDNKAAAFYDTQCNDYQETEIERTNNLNNMQKIISRLLKKGNTVVGTQTDPIEGLDLSLNNQQDEEDDDGHNHADPVEKQKSIEESIPTKGQAAAQNQRLVRARPGAMDLYGRPNALQTIDTAKMGELHMRLNILLSNPVKKMKGKGSTGLKTEGAQGVLSEGKQVWTTPAILLLFLQNTIESCTETPEADLSPMSPTTPASHVDTMEKQELKMKIPAWQDFKQLIFDIYDHRIFNAPEINGMINTNYMGLDEHLICFFLNKYQTRQIVEKKIIEFLASLKYFVDHWGRAKQYANLAGFLQADQSYIRRSGTSDTRPPKRLNDGKFDEAELPGSDIYIQEFFLHCYSMVIKERKNFQESKEGFSYMQQKNEERMSPKLLTFVVPTDLKKWELNLKRFIKKIKKDPSDDYDTEYIDVDQLLSLYIDWFKANKREKQRDLSKYFQRVTGDTETRADISVDNVQSILQNAQSKQSFQFLSFGGSISQLRALTFAMMCGSNDYNVYEQEFISGCNRFGLDNPAPIITRRLSTYGNEENIEKLLERLSKQYNDTNFLDPEKFTSVLPDKFAKTALEVAPSAKQDKLVLKDMEETSKMKRTGKKVSGVHDIKMLDRMDNAKKFESPANVVLARTVTIKIKDIPKNTTLKGKLLAQEKSTNKEMSMQSGVNDQIVVPSFGTVGALFARHLDILRKMKRRIILLKQAFTNQQDEDRSWEQVDQIIRTLEQGCSYLNFDEISTGQTTAVKPSMKSGQVTPAEKPAKQFYEDPTLLEDEHRLAVELEEKRMINEALQPMSLDLNTPQHDQSLSKVPSSAMVTTAVDGAKQDLKPVAEEEDR